MTAEEMVEEMKAAEGELPRCGCGAALMLRYEPGLTFAGCVRCGRLSGVADWDPRGLVELMVSEVEAGG